MSFTSLGLLFLAVLVVCFAVLTVLAKRKPAIEPGPQSLVAAFTADLIQQRWIVILAAGVVVALVKILGLPIGELPMKVGLAVAIVAIFGAREILRRNQASASKGMPGSPDRTQ